MVAKAKKLGDVIADAVRPITHQRMHAVMLTLTSHIDQVLETIAGDPLADLADLFDDDSDDSDQDGENAP